MSVQNSFSEFSGEIFSFMCCAISLLLVEITRVLSGLWTSRTFPGLILGGGGLSNPVNIRLLNVMKSKYFIFCTEP